MSRKFDHQGYPTGPHAITEDLWYYVQKEGVIICGRGRFGDPMELSIMSWRSIRQALKDHDNAKGRRSVTNGEH